MPTPAEGAGPGRAPRPGGGSGAAAPLRVALDVTALLGPRTGVGAFVAELVAGLAVRDEVEVVAFATSWRGRHQLPAAVPAGVRVATRPLPAALAHRAWRRLDLPPVEWWTGPVDVVHGPNYVVAPARRAARVVSVHDLTVLRHPEWCDPAALAHPPLLRRAVAGGAWVHVDATVVGEDVVAHLGAPPERVVRVPLAPAPVPEADPAAGRRLAGRDRYVLALGTLEPRKGLPGLVRAFDRLAGGEGLGDVGLVLAGPPGWGVEAVEAAVAAARHRDRIRVLGWVGADDRAALVRGASVLAYPSLDEGFGLPPLEAMSVGTPVVASRAGALPETLGDGAALVGVGDEAALAEALATTLTDEAGRRGLLERGRAQVARYSWDRTVDALVDLYRRAAAERPAGPPPGPV